MWLHKFRREGTAQEEAHEQFMLRFVTGLFSASAPGQDPSGEERIKRWEGDLMKALGLFRHAHVRMCFADLVIEHITALAAGPFSSGSGRSFSGSGSSLIDGGGGGAGGAGGGSDRGPGRRTAATAPASGTGEAVCISVASFDYLVATLNAMLRECSNHREFDAAKPFVDLSNVIYCAPAAEVEGGALALSSLTTTEQIAFKGGGGGAGRIFLRSRVAKHELFQKARFWEDTFADVAAEDRRELHGGSLELMTAQWASSASHSGAQREKDRALLTRRLCLFAYVQLSFRPPAAVVAFCELTSSSDRYDMRIDAAALVAAAQAEQQRQREQLGAAGSTAPKSGGRGSLGTLLRRGFSARLGIRSSETDSLAPASAAAAAAAAVPAPAPAPAPVPAPVAKGGGGSGGPFTFDVHLGLLAKLAPLPMAEAGSAGGAGGAAVDDGRGDGAVQEAAAAAQVVVFKTFKRKSMLVSEINRASLVPGFAAMGEEGEEGSSAEDDEGGGSGGEETAGAAGPREVTFADIDGLQTVGEERAAAADGDDGDGDGGGGGGGATAGAASAAGAPKAASKSAYELSTAGLAGSSAARERAASEKFGGRKRSSAKRSSAATSRRIPKASSAFSMSTGGPARSGRRSGRSGSVIARVKAARDSLLARKDGSSADPRDGAPDSLSELRRRVGLLPGEHPVWNLHCGLPRCPRHAPMQEGPQPPSALSKGMDQLWLTNHRLIFCSDSAQPEPFALPIPLLSIAKVERAGDAAGGSAQALQPLLLVVSGKDGRVVEFPLSRWPHEVRKVDPFFCLLEHYAFPDFYGELREAPRGPRTFPFYHRAALDAAPDARAEPWAYGAGTEIARQVGDFGAAFDQRWRETGVNKGYELCPTYPAALWVPKAVDDAALGHVGHFRSKGRIPALTWWNRQNGAAILRCSQPLVGVGRSRCPEDERYFADAGIKFIFDARPFKNAMANMAIGKGYEMQSNYEGVEVFFLDIENIHVMRSSLTRLMDLTCGMGAVPMRDGHGDEHWLTNLESNKWLSHVQQVLVGSVKMARVVTGQGQSGGETVVVHCSDGWDRTSQLCALSQLMIDPFFRTIEGFRVLVEKDWCAFGYMFAKRTGHGEKCANAADDQRSPIFLQFLDCVWQLSVQQPAAFEFNSDYLGAIMDEVLSCRYGTFLYNCEREREQAGVHDKTASVWEGLLEAGGRARFLNPFYDRRLSGFGAESPFLRAGWTPSIRNIKLWPYHARWNPQMMADLERADTTRMAAAELQVRRRAKCPLPAPPARACTRTPCPRPRPPCSLARSRQLTAPLHRLGEHRCAAPPQSLREQNRQLQAQLAQLEAPTPTTPTSLDVRVARVLTERGDDSVDMAGMRSVSDASSGSEPDDYGYDDEAEAPQSAAPAAGAAAAEVEDEDRHRPSAIAEETASGRSCTRGSLYSGRTASEASEFSSSQIPLADV